MSDLFGSDAFSPRESAARVESIAVAKVSMPFGTAFFKGVLCNVLVCMAVWMALAGRSVAGKAMAIVFPVSAFVAAGFEHSIANMYFIPLAMLLQAFGDVGAAAPLTWAGFAGNLVLVGLVYYVIYLRAPAAVP